MPIVEIEKLRKINAQIGLNKSKDLNDLAIVDNILFDVQDSLKAEWKKSFPKGMLPDRVGFLLSEVRREYRKLLAEADHL